MTAQATTERNYFAGVWRAVIVEPLELGISQPHQLLISMASGALVASEAAYIVPWPFNILMAIGAEWGYLRGLASGQGLKTVWGKRLIFAAAALGLLYGAMWSFRETGILPKKIDGVPFVQEWPVALAVTLVHLLTITAVSVCSAMVHRESIEAEQAAAETERRRQQQDAARLAQTEQAAKLRTEADDAAHRRALEDRRLAAELEERANDAKLERGLRLAAVKRELSQNTVTHASQNTVTTPAVTPSQRVPTRNTDTERARLVARLHRARDNGETVVVTHLVQELGLSSRGMYYKLLNEAKAKGEYREG